MQIKVAYDGHPTGWCLLVEAETEAEAAALQAWVRSTNNGAVLRVGHVNTDFSDPAQAKRSRMFRVELMEKKDDSDRVGFKAPERERTVSEIDPVAAPPLPVSPDA